MTTVGSASRVRVRTSSGAIFLWILLAATSIPFVALPILARIPHPGLGPEKTMELIVFLASGVHVAGSYAFYVDPDMQAILRGNPRRFLVAPAALVIGSTVLYTVASTKVAATYVLANLVWQTHHYTKQNIGVVAFTAKASGSPSPSTVERRDVMAGGYAGILGVITLGSGYTVTWLRGFKTEFEISARLLLAVAIILGCLALPAVLRTGSAFRFAFFAISVLFYLPLFVWHNPLAATSYAFAHGFQYLVFLGYIGQGGRDRRVRWVMTATLAGMALTGGLALAYMQDSRHWGSIARPVFGFYLALVMIHFVIDAGIWRLRDPANRNYMRKRFAFLG